MPPKKNVESPEKPLLGRPSNNVTMGIVGLPNVGKSTLFNTISKLDIPAENFPFCTIEPNVCRVPVPDERYDFLVEHHKPKSEVPAMLQITDIAGLVRGAHAGQGLGNAFLSHIYAVDAIAHVLRAFDDADVVHVEDSVDPIRDLEIINEELILKDQQIIANKVEQLTKQTRAGQDKKKIADLEICKRVQDWLNDKKLVRHGDWNAKDIEVLNEIQLITAKPTMYLINLSEKDYIRKKNKWLAKIKAWVDDNTPGELMIPFSGALESNIVSMDEAQKADYLKDLGEGVQSNLPKIITQGYHALQLVHFFTCGADEVKCWTIRKGTKAPQAAGTIHTDFEKGFICAEVMKYDEFKEAGSEAACKAAGKYRQEGRNYVVNDADIIFFKFNPTGGKK